MVILLDTATAITTTDLFLYVSALITGLIFCAVFWPMLFTIMMFFTKKRKK